MTDEQIWAFEKPQTVGSICRTPTYRWCENELIDPTQPMYILREATRAEWEAQGGHVSYVDPVTLFFYAVSVD
jgi:hypothetical protein